MRPLSPIAAALLAGASLLALAPSAQAGRILFSSARGAALGGRTLPAGSMKLSDGLTQLQTDDGGVLSFVGPASVAVGEGGAITVQAGQFTAAAGSGPMTVGLPAGGVASVSGEGGAGSFSVSTTGGVTGRALSGSASLTSGGVTRTFPAGQPFRAAAGAPAQAAVTAGVQTVSAPAPGALIDQPTSAQDVLNNAELIAANVGATGVPVIENPLLIRAPAGPPAELLAFLLNNAATGEAPVFTQASSQLLSAQLAFLQGGGAPGTFDAQVAAATAAAYARFLAAGGAAGAYSGASAAQLQAYLAYLNQPGVIDAVDAAARAQLAAYQSLLASGAPSLSSAAAAQALAAYIAFLNAGGANADYGGASQAALQSYLGYIRAFGLPSGLDATTAGLIVSYLAYLGSGGTFGAVPVSTAPPPSQTTTPPADPSLPATTTPTTPSTPTTPAAGGLGSGPTKLATAVAGLYAGGPGDPGVPTITLDANGRPTNLGFYGAPGTATLIDVQNGSGWLIGRFANGTFGSGSNQQTYGPNTGAHFVVQTPVSAIPAGGTLFYKAAAYTAPTRVDGAGVAAVAVDFNLGVTFGSAPKFGFNGVVSLDSQSFGFSTAGGAAAPSLTNVYAASGELDLYGTAPLTSVTTGLCSSTAACKVNANITAGGAGAATFGGAYGLIDTATNTAKVIGAVLLTPTASPGSAGMASSGGGSTGGGSTGGGSTGGGSSGGGSGSGGSSSGLAPASGSDRSFSAQGPGVARSPVTGTVVADAAAATLASARTPTVNTAVRNTAVDADNGGVAGIVGWTRWTSGVVTLNDGTNTTLTANQGVHLAWGAPVTNMPTSGTATYDLVGATKPTFNDGSASPGTFTGTLGVAFAGMKVGWSANVAIGGQNYAFSTSGGAAAPSATLGADGRWVGSTEVANGFAGRGYGFLAGDGASHAGMTYFLTQTAGGANALTISGAAAFAKQ